MRTTTRNPAKSLIDFAGEILKYYASVSFGKDSLAMLLYILENGLPLDEVVFYDTGMEFETIYEIRDKVKKLLQEYGIKYTELHPQRAFEYDMLHRIKTKRDGSKVSGDGWCGGACRWGTFAKLNALNRYIGNNHTYVGIAADEKSRLEYLESHKSSPIADAGMTEADCLTYCHERGFFWNECGVELYGILDRVSCWCCRNKNMKELRNIYWNLPKYWKRLRELQMQIREPIKGKYGSVFDLEKRFEFEKYCESAGISTTSKGFYKKLKEHLNGQSNIKQA